MSGLFIDNLGITRLRKLAQILGIPRYTTFKNVEDLRDHISTFLTKKGEVKRSHLAKIQKTTSQINRLTKEIRELAAVRKEVSKKKSLSKVGTLPDVDMRLRDLISRLNHCQGELIKCEGAKQPLDPKVKAALAEHLGKTDDAMVDEMIKELLSRDKQLEEQLKEIAKSLQEEQIKAIQALEKAQQSGQELDSLKKTLEEKLLEARALEKSGQEISAGTKADLEKASANLAKAVEEHGKCLAETETQRTIITELQSNLSHEQKEKSLFATELAEMRQKFSSLSEEFEKIKTENASCKISLDEVFEQLGACTENVRKCDAAFADVDRLSKELQECQTNLGLRQIALDKTTRSYRERASDYGGLDKRYNALLAENADMKKKIGALQAKLQAMRMWEKDTRETRQYDAEVRHKQDRIWEDSGMDPDEMRGHRKFVDRPISEYMVDDLPASIPEEKDDSKSDAGSDAGSDLENDAGDEIVEDGYRSDPDASDAGSDAESEAGDDDVYHDASDEDIKSEDNEAAESDDEVADLSNPEPVQPEKPKPGMLSYLNPFPRLRGIGKLAGFRG